MPRLNYPLRLLLCFLSIFLPLSSLDLWFYDHLFQIRGQLDNATSIILVRVNENQLNYPSLIQSIQLDHPELIVFCSFFDAHEAFDTSGLPYDNILYSASINEENKLILPEPSLTQRADRFGFNNLFPDSDNTIRKGPLVYNSTPSLALRTFFFKNPSSLSRNLMEPIQIDFRGPSGSYRLYDATRIINQMTPPRTFKDKIVLIAKESTLNQDVETPLGRLSRVEVQANFIDTFLQGREIRNAPHSVVLAIAALSVLISAVLIHLFPLTLAWLFLVLFSLILVLFALLLLSTAKWWIGLANPICGIFVTHLIMLGYKLRKQEQLQWKWEQESVYLKEMDQFKNNFISLFSHDLKTPIAKIRAITERLLSSHAELPATIKEDLKTLDRTNDELSRLISDILKVTKMETLSLEPQKGVIDLNRLVELALQRLQFNAEEKKIQIVTDLEPLFSMEGDPQWIEEVIANLVENAIKYSPPSSTITIKTQELKDRVLLTVIDQGMGIDLNELPKITGKFFRGKRASETTKGTGLGLYLSKYFIELHNGGLEVKSETGKGTEVGFWLPLSV